MPLNTIRSMVEGGYAVVDLETTGLSPSSDSILEVGVIAAPGGVPSTPVSRMVRVEKVPDIITEITGITQDEMEEKGEPLEEVLQWVHETVGELPIVGHNFTQFDCYFFTHEAKPFLRGRPWLRQLGDRNRCIDTAALFKGWRRGLSMGPGQSLLAYQDDVLQRRVAGLKYNLGYCTEHLRIDLSGMRLHRAAADVFTTSLVFQELTTRLATKEAHVLRPKTATHRAKHVAIRKTAPRIHQTFLGAAVARRCRDTSRAEQASEGSRAPE